MGIWDKFAIFVPRNKFCGNISCGFVRFLDSNIKYRTYEKLPAHAMQERKQKAVFGDGSLRTAVVMYCASAYFVSDSAHTCLCINMFVVL